MDSAGAGAFAVPLSPWRGGAVITLGGADFVGGAHLVELLLGQQQNGRQQWWMLKDHESRHQW